MDCDYQELSDDDESFSEIECEWCQTSQNANPRRVKCSECKHIACIHYSRKVLLTSLNEKLPRWLCNTCLKRISIYCARVKNESAKY